MPHVYKDPRYLAQSLTDKPGRTPFYYDKKYDAYDSLLSDFQFGDAKYIEDRKSALDKLKGLYIDEPLSDQDANDIIDAYITRTTHYNNKPSQANLRKKAGRFETGRNWDEAQANAQQLLKQYPNAQGVVYGLRYEDETPRGNSGLKNPFIVYDDDLENIARALNLGNKKSRFQFDTLYNN